MIAQPIGFRELVFREDWNAIPAARPVTQEHVAHPDLVLSLHGPGAAQIKKSHHEHLQGDPYYIWSGMCAGAWALSLRHRSVLVDFSRTGLVRWRARQSGSHRLHLILKPEGRPWLISDCYHEASAEWREFEIEVAKVAWLRFDIASCTTCEGVAATDKVAAGQHDRPAIVEEPVGIGLDLIDAVGVTDCMPGRGSGNCSRLDWIEAWGRALCRTSA